MLVAVAVQVTGYVIKFKILQDSNARFATPHIPYHRVLKIADAMGRKQAVIGDLKFSSHINRLRHKIDTLKYDFVGSSVFYAPPFCFLFHGKFALRMPPNGTANDCRHSVECFWCANSIYAISMNNGQAFLPIKTKN
jgi:hypothetical protein